MFFFYVQLTNCRLRNKPFVSHFSMPVMQLWIIIFSLFFEFLFVFWFPYCLQSTWTKLFIANINFSYTLPNFDPDRKFILKTKQKRSKNNPKTIQKVLWFPLLSAVLNCLLRHIRHKGPFICCPNVLLAWCPLHSLCPTVRTRKLWNRKTTWKPYLNYLSGGFAMTQKVFELGSSNFLAFLTNAHHLRLKAGLLYLLPESSGILPYFTYCKEILHSYAFKGNLHIFSFLQYTFRNCKCSHIFCLITRFCN